MSFPRVQAYEHATLRVDDLPAAREFCVDVLGLVELGAEGDTVYLGCGYDENHDLALRRGGTGVDHFALRVAAPEALDDAADRLRAAGVQSSRRRDGAPGQADALVFELPSGHSAGLVVPADDRQLETYRPAHRVNAVAPLDGDHVNLMATDVRAVMDFLTEALDFQCSDYTQDADSGTCLAAWIRRSAGHHDVGITAGAPHETLHHVAFAYAGIDHLKTALDALSAAGHRLELGLGRHPVGANLYAYLWTPGGNRFELCAEGAILGDATPPRRWNHMGETLNAWSDAPPPSTFRTGS